MTVEDVERRIKAIEAEAGSPERTHPMEDGLLEDVLFAIASGQSEDPAKVAEAALKVLELGLSRWYE